jgi:hypothetical protein
MVSITLIINSCIIYPWTNEEYEEEVLNNYSIYNGIPVDSLLYRYCINGLFVPVRIDAKTNNRSLYDHSGPYVVNINVLGKSNYKKIFLIENVKIWSDNRNYQDQIIQTPIYYHSDQQLEFNPYYYVKGKYFLMYDGLADECNFNFKNKEVIYVDVTLGVLFQDYFETKTIRYKFIPKKKKGLIQWMN